VLLLFGAYRGTVRITGFRWCNPFARRVKISLRARNLVSDQLKVNDRRGNPIEIAAVVVWRIADTAQALFDVENYDNYVRIQIEAALRHLASQFAYDGDEDSEELSLRAGSDRLLEVLQEELQARLGRAGAVAEEARLTHLAYAPEIAQTMLRRQQAEAVISARKKIVQGAVSMVEMALKELEGRGVIDFDPERRAAMVSNLLVVLCGESETKPVINTGTLYH
jgi:regulator of protease activity HflC (stomatin/prohibitin superfamily)